MNSFEKLYNISRKLTILYVEDDLFLQAKTKSIFNNLFKSTDIASDGYEALEKYEVFNYTNNHFYDIVITDIQMPKLDGVKLIKKILELNKDQKIIIISAYSDTANLISFINLGVTRFIQKPFTTEQIINLLLEVVSDIENNTSENIFKIDDNLEWNKVFKELKNNNKPIKLSYNEQLILDILINNPTQIFSNYDLYYILKNENFEKEFSIDSIKSIVKRLRQKIPYDTIENIYGQGYKLHAQG
jgi:DNA-binding response OmpR family regulator